MNMTPLSRFPITEASRRGVSRLVADAEHGHPAILRRRSEPVAAVISCRDLQRLTNPSSGATKKRKAQRHSRSTGDEVSTGSTAQGAPHTRIECVQSLADVVHAPILHP